MAYFEEDDYNVPFNWASWKKLMPFIMRYKKRFLMVIIGMIIVAVCDTIGPLIQKYAVDNFIEKGTSEGLVGYTLVYFAAVLIPAVGFLMFCRGGFWLEMKIGYDLKKTAFNHLQTLSFSYYNVTPVGYIIARVMSDTGRISGMVAWGLVDILWSAFYVVGVFVIMFILNAQLALIVLIVVPLIALVTAYFQGKFLAVNRRIRKINSRITGAFNEGISGARTSKTLVIEDDNLANFAGITGEMYSASIHSVRLGAIFIPIVLFISSMAAAFVLTRGGNLVMQSIIPIGTLSAFVTYSIGIFEPIQNIARNLSELISMQANIERVTSLLEREPDITDSPEVIEKYGDSFHPKRENWESIRGDIEFRNVTFRYPDGTENVLEDFDLTIPAGSAVAIVGETGAGKSTLVNLACRFFEPTEGKILIDGVDYRERSQLWLHSNIGYVLQNPHLFSGSIRENLRYGRLDATDAEIEEAARLVSADQVVAKLEDGYDSDVGEGGDRLSTGEKQLISFARAVLADPAILVLDEATSSIDTETERLIQEATAKLLKGRTSFLIAHRLSTIRHADMILVVQNGKIIERGTHKELLRKKGYYFNLYTKQFEAEASAVL